MAKKFYRWNAAADGMDAILVFDRSIFYGYDSKSFLNTKLNLQRPVVNHFVLRQFFSSGHFMKKGKLDRSVGVFASPMVHRADPGPRGSVRFERTACGRGFNRFGLTTRELPRSIPPAAVPPEAPGAASRTIFGSLLYWRISPRRPGRFNPVRRDPRRSRLRACRMDKQWGRKQMPPSPHSRRCPRERQHARVPHGFHFSYGRIAF